MKALFFEAALLRLIPTWQAEEMACSLPDSGPARVGGREGKGVSEGERGRGRPTE